jgi:hypothetical protein
VTVVIDDGVPEDTIEPRNNLFVLYVSATLQSPSKCRLQNVFGSCPGFDAPLQKGQELAVSCYKLRNRLRR